LIEAAKGNRCGWDATMILVASGTASGLPKYAN
jgi:hypothetical protein